MKNILLENLIKEQVKLVLNEILCEGILLESFKDAFRIFVQQSDLPIEDIKTKIQTFKDLAKKNQIKDPKEKDIGYWIKQGFEKFNKFISQFEGVETKTQQIKKAKTTESITAYEDDQHLVVIPLSEKASCFYGRETRWCTAATKGKNYFDEYTSLGVVLFYVINKNTGEKHAAAYAPKIDEFELFDAEDHTVSAENFPFNLDLLRNLAKKHSKQVENIKEQILNQFKGKDLSGQNLRGKIFAGYNFERTNLKGANLQGANLYNANLEGADLEGADLEGANLIYADFIEANLFRANLEGVNLQKTNLRGSNFQGANLKNANLVGASLFRASLQGASLQGANLRNAELVYANLIGANLQGADLQKANLQVANLSGTNLQRANLSGTNLQRANLQKTDFRGANLEGHNIKDLIARGAIVK